MSHVGTVLITGGGSGIGRAAALKFSTIGYQCAVADINKDSALETVKLLHGCGHIAIHVDVSDAESVRSMVQGAAEHFGGCINVAFNNAGIECAKGKMHSYPDQAFDQILAVNLKGVWLCMKYEIQQMLKQPLLVSNSDMWANMPTVCQYKGVRGSIVNTSSSAGLEALPEFTPYCASKWGVIGLTKSAAIEYAAEGIRINAVCPSATHTPMLGRVQQQHPELLASAIASHPVGRIAAPEEVAEAVAWLAGDSCPFITGESLKIGGGI